MKARLPGMIILIMFVVSLFVIGAIGFIDIQKVPQDEINDFVDHVDKVVSDNMTTKQIGAMAVCIIHDGEVKFSKGYGYQDAEKTIPVSEDTLFQVASVSKPFTAWGIMKLVENGTLDLDTPVTTYIPDWQFPLSEFDENGVTIRRMLSHSSGIANVGGYSGVENIEDLQTLEESLISANDAKNEDVRIIYQPGTKYQYSGGAYTLMQYLIEQVTNQSFEDFMQEQIFHPLGMENSSYSQTPESYKSLAVVFDNQGNPVPSRYFASQSAAGLKTTVSDLSKWALAMISVYADSIQNGILDENTLRLMYQPQSEPESKLPYGLGYMVQEVGGPQKILEVSHTGHNLPNWYALVATLPEEGEGLIILTNSADGLLVRNRLHSDWLIWSCGRDSFGNRIDRMINAALYVLPVFIICTVLILIWCKFRKH